MVAAVDIANRALSSIGTRSTIASLIEQSNEARQCNLLIQPLRQELLRMAPWNCATFFNNLAVICAAPGTPENPSATQTQWERGIPPPPWAYEYAYPSDCLRPLWIVPQFSTGFSSGIPITTAVTGGAPQYWNGPPITFKVATDEIGPDGTPEDGGHVQRVILTNQEDAILCYIKDVSNPDVMDQQFIQAWVAGLAGRLAFSLTGNKDLANMKIGEANSYVQIARAGDGNEGLTINNTTPDWIRIRGVSFNDGSQYGPYINGFDFGGFLSAY